MNNEDWTAALDAELADLALSVAPITPPAALKSRLMATIGRTNRFEPFADTLAGLIDVTVDKARELLAWIDDATRWEPGPGPGIQLVHLEGHTGLADALTGWVKVPAGTEFPDHEHLGREIVMPVQGSYVDDDGSTVGPGEVAEAHAGTHHTLRIPADGPDLVYLAVIYEGVRIGDLVLRPGDDGM